MIDELAAMLSDYERRISALERGGTHPAVVTTPEGETDLLAAQYDSQGRVMSATSLDERGLIYPFDHSAWTPAQDVPVYSTSWKNVAVTSLFWPAQEVLRFEFDVEAPSGQGMQFRLWNGTSEQSTLTGYTGTGAAQHVVCEWVHPYEVGLGVDTAAPNSEQALVLQARCTTAPTGFNFPKVQLPWGLAFVSKPVAINASATSPFRVEGTDNLVGISPSDEFDHMALGQVQDEIFVPYVTNPATWWTIAETGIFNPRHDCLRFSFEIESFTPSESIQFRLYDVEAGAAVTNVITLVGNNTDRELQCEWLHDYLGASTKRLQLQARQSVSSAVAITVLPPVGAVLIDSPLADNPSATQPFTEI